jgi:hypothetical protein
MDERERRVERETTIIQTGERGSGGTIAVVILLALIAIAAFLYFSGALQRAADDTNININVDAPNVELPDINLDTTPAPANKS